MKFCDKLIQLRKKNGLSQEELGDKLNVTRQTVSKWEMGQCKPETDKLIEMSKLFNVELNDLIDDNKNIEKVNDNSNIKHFTNDDLKPRTWLLVVLIIITIIIVIILGSKFVSNLSDKKNNNFWDKFDFEEPFANINDSVSKESFNNEYFLNIGKETGDSVSELFDKVINNNKNNTNHIISIKYEDLLTNDATEIENIRTELKLNDEYEVKAEYDAKGYINVFVIEKIKNSSKAKSFNFMYEAHNGTNVGIRVKNVLDDVITNNKTNSDHIIRVVYYSINTDNVDEIRNLKKSFDDWTDYEIILDYDEYGYINQITIEN